jgi:hypothetical protein
MTITIGKLGQTDRMGRSEHDSKDRTAKTGELEIRVLRQDWTVGTG